MSGKLILIPTIISDNTVDFLFTQSWRESIKHVQHFCVENVRTARRFLSSLKVFPSIEELQFSVIDKETPSDKISELLKPLHEGIDVGLISESGLPAVADPGNLAVTYAHEKGFNVTVLPGPSSIMLALAASGFNGQQFSFHGYLPIDDVACGKAIQALEKESRTKNQTQIFIETPFRNNRLLKILLKSLSSSTRLCAAVDLTGSEEKIISRSVKSWPSVELPKLPTVFLFMAK